jgi:hypothetical protein
MSFKIKGQAPQYIPKTKWERWVLFTYHQGKISLSPILFNLFQTFLLIGQFAPANLSSPIFPFLFWFSAFHPKAIFPVDGKIHETAERTRIHRTRERSKEFRLGVDQVSPYTFPLAQMLADRSKLDQQVWCGNNQTGSI